MIFEAEKINENENFSSEPMFWSDLDSLVSEQVKE